MAAEHNEKATALKAEFDKRNREAQEQELRAKTQQSLQAKTGIREISVLKLGEEHDEDRESTIDSAPTTSWPTTGASPPERQYPDNEDDDFSRRSWTH